MAEQIHLTRDEFAALAASAGLTLDSITLGEFFGLYSEHLVPILARLRRQEPLESEVRMPPATGR
jgi:hypothetical protein